MKTCNLSKLKSVRTLNVLINSNITKKIAVLFLMFILLVNTTPKLRAQEVNRLTPTWWWGISLGANLNLYEAWMRKLSNTLTSPVIFREGDGVAPYASLLMEYRPNDMWGGMLNISYDGRGGGFEQVKLASGDHKASLVTSLSYISIEPSIKWMPFSSGFYLFTGPELNFNASKGFSYEQGGELPKTESSFSKVRSTMFSGQIGAGYDILITPKSKKTWVEVSPFISGQSFFGTKVRTIQNWTIITGRVGVALKFGKSKEVVQPIKMVEEKVVTPVVEKEVQFTVKSPGMVRTKRNVNETFPLRNYVFFEKDSSNIPGRYVMLNKEEAKAFKEEQLLNLKSSQFTGPTAQKLNIYYNILNITGDRMRNNPKSTITLVGSSAKGKTEGKMMAMKVKQYLVNEFGIDSTRIMVTGRVKPLIPTEEEGFGVYSDLQRVEDNRVDIISESPELLMEAGTSDSTMLNPIKLLTVQEDPIDNNIIFNNAGAREILSSWSIDITDVKGQTKHFGPYMQDQVSISGKTFLGNSNYNTYKVVMTGQSKSGKEVKKESTFTLALKDEPETGLRFSILFDFDKYETVASYTDYLTKIVASFIPANGTVIIHGHTDIIGQEEYNKQLSDKRAEEAKKILEQAVQKNGTMGVKFETYGYGADEKIAPYGNKLPEERCYNRTVIIDIIPAK